MSPLNNVRSKNQPFFFVLGKKSKAAARNAASCWSSSWSSWSWSSSSRGICGAWVDRESNVTTSPRKVVFENASHFLPLQKNTSNSFVRGLSQKTKTKNKTLNPKLLREKKRAKKREKGKESFERHKRLYATPTKARDLLHTSLSKAAARSVITECRRRRRLRRRRLDAARRVPKKCR